MGLGGYPPRHFFINNCKDSYMEYAIHLDSNTSPEVVSEGFNQERAQRYAAASRSVPLARANEGGRVQAALDRLGINNFDCIVELGTGQGFGTSMLLERLSPKGMIYGIDASPHMLNEAKDDVRLRRHMGALDQLRLESESVDFAFSIAAFHHIPNKWLMLEELGRVLKPGAKFLIVDVAHNTPAQRFFDYVVRPHCSSGHDADFLDKSWASSLAARSGFNLDSAFIEDTDWMYDSKESMLDYACDLFSLGLTPERVSPLLDTWLQPYENATGRWVMPWSLGFFVLSKPQHEARV